MDENENENEDDGRERGDEPPRVPLWPDDETWIRARERDAELKDLIRKWNDRQKERRGLGS